MSMLVIQKARLRGILIARGGYKSRGVARVELSQDRKRVHLMVDGLASLDVVTHFSLMDVKSAGGGDLYSNEAWYTLNAIADRSWDPASTSAGKRDNLGFPSRLAVAPSGPGLLTVQVALEGEYSVSLHGLDGRRLDLRKGRGNGTFRFSAGPSRAVYLVRLESG